MIIQKRSGSNTFYMKRNTLKMPEVIPYKGMNTRATIDDQRIVETYVNPGNNTEYTRVTGFTNELKQHDDIPCALLNDKPLDHVKKVTMNRSSFPNQHCPINLKAIRDENGTLRRHTLPDISVHIKWNEKLTCQYTPRTAQAKHDLITHVVDGDFVITLKNGKPISAKRTV